MDQRRDGLLGDSLQEDRGDFPAEPAQTRLPPLSQPDALIARSVSSSARTAGGPPATGRPALKPASKRAATLRAWRYRLEGAAIASLMALALATLGASGVDAPPLATVDADGGPPLAEVGSLASTEPETDTAAESAPDAGSDGGSTLSDAALIEWVSAAEPPYQVVLHVAPEANPRDVARLETAIRAWGFAPPLVREAQEPVVLPEVAFHHEEDREAALLLARIADSILTSAVLTPPALSDGPETTRGTLDLMVVTR